MCSLCSSDPIELSKARLGASDTADKLDTLAAYYRNLSYGINKPHGETGTLAGHHARELVRRLVDDWV